MICRMYNLFNQNYTKIHFRVDITIFFIAMIFVGDINILGTHEPQ